MNKQTKAHSATQTHRYIMHYPEHPAREGDPHYKDFHAYHKKHRATARCHIGERIGFEECRDSQGNSAIPVDNESQPGLELHHAHVEFSLVNSVDFKALSVDYPGIDDPNSVGAWVESGTNFRWLCAWHHRGASGAHNASHSDFEASQYIHGLITNIEEKEDE